MDLWRSGWIYDILEVGWIGFDGLEMGVCQGREELKVVFGFLFDCGDIRVVYRKEEEQGREENYILDILILKC